MKLNTNIYKLPLLWLLLIGCTGYMLLACNNTEPKPIQKRKFVLTKDSTFIGTWVGRAFIQKEDMHDSLTAYFSLYSKDSILYMYRDYWLGEQVKREEPDSAILAWAMRWAEVLKFTPREDAHEGIFNFYGNDSTLYTDSIVLIQTEYLDKNEDSRISENKRYYLIDSLNLLHYVDEGISFKNSNREARSKYIRYTLQPYEYKKQD